MCSSPGLSGWHPDQEASHYPQPTSQKDTAIRSSSAPADVSKLSFNAVSSPLSSAQSLPASTLAPQNSRPMAPANSPTLSEPPHTATSSAHSPPKALEQHSVPATGHHRGPQEEQPRQYRHEAASRTPSQPAASSPQPAAATLDNQAPLHTSLSDDSNRYVRSPTTQLSTSSQKEPPL